MSKRFVDTDLWQKSWFQELEAKEKLIVLYLFQNCDCAGVWDVNYRLAGFILGFTINQDMIVKINQKHLLFDFFKEDKILVLDFIKFQYGTLSENCKPHKPIIEKLKKYGLYERVLKGYPKGIETLEEKEQEQYKEKEKEKDISIYGEYQNVSLSKEHYDKLLALCLSEKLLNELINSFSVNIEVGKERPYEANLPNAHYERLRSYYNFRKKNPEKFQQQKEEHSRVIEDWYKKEKARLAKKGIY